MARTLHVHPERESQLQPSRSDETDALSSPQIPSDLDFRIMLTFLELYQTLLGFVFFKLFNDINLVYPPKLDDVLDENGAGIGALLLEESGKGLVVVRDETVEEAERKHVYAKDVRKQIREIGLRGNDAAEAVAVAEDEAMGSAPTATVTSMDDIELDVFPSTSTSDPEQPEFTNASTNLFSSYYFYLSREVTRPTLEFVIRSFSGQVGWDAVLGAGSPYTENDPRITHHVLDRPDVPGAAPRSHPGKRAYIQPQWVVDCLNKKVLLPTEEFAPGRTLPPHLSPFVDEDAVRERGGYVPMESTARVDDSEMLDAEEEEDDEDEDEMDDEVEEVVAKPTKSKKASALLAAAKDPKNETLLHAAELEAEARGVAPAQFEAELAAETKKAKKESGKKSTGPKKVDRSQEEQLASIMLTGKQKKLYNKLSYSRDRKAEEASPIAYVTPVGTRSLTLHRVHRPRSWRHERRRSRRRRGSRRSRGMVCKCLSEVAICRRRRCRVSGGDGGQNDDLGKEEEGVDSHLCTLRAGSVNDAGRSSSVLGSTPRETRGPALYPTEEARLRQREAARRDSCPPQESFILWLVCEFDGEDGYRHA
jgi:hypothetical protein